MDGKTIKEIRVKLGMTQNAFADRLGVRWITVNRWENSNQKPSPLALKELLKAQLDASRISAGR